MVEVCEPLAGQIAPCTSLVAQCQCNIHACLEKRTRISSFESLALTSLHTGLPVQACIVNADGRHRLDRKLSDSNTIAIEFIACEVEIPACAFRERGYFLNR